MSKTKTETEVLMERINLTMEEVYDVVRKGVASRYNSIKMLRACTTVDDLTQKVILYYLDEMPIGDRRLDHYIKKYNNKQHIINLIRQTSYQLPVSYAKSQEAINQCKMLSLDYGYYLNDSYLEFGEIVEDVKATREIFDNLMLEDFKSILRKELNRVNLKLLKQARQNICRVNKLNLKKVLPELQATAKEKTDMQMQLIQYMCDGYTAVEARKKGIINVNKNIKIIKSVLKTVVNKYQKV